MVLGYEPYCSLIGWRSICLSVQFPRLSEDSISPSPRRQPRDSPSQLFSTNLERRGHEYRSVTFGVGADRFHGLHGPLIDRKSTRLNSSHVRISYAVFCLK